MASSTALLNRVAVSLIRWEVDEAELEAARYVNEPSKRILTHLANNQARTSDIRIMVGEEEAVEAATTTEVVEEVVEDGVAMVVAKMKTVSTNKVAITEVRFNAVAAIRVVGAVDKAIKVVVAVVTTTRVVAIMAVMAAVVAIRTVAAVETVVTIEAVVITKASIVRLATHLLTRNAKSNSVRSRCDCPWCAQAKSQQESD